MTTRRSMHVHVDRVGNHYEIAVVEVNAAGQSQDFAKINTSDLWTGLRMAVPYMASVAQETPFDDVLGA